MKERIQQQPHSVTWTQPLCKLCNLDTTLLCNLDITLCKQCNLDTTLCMQCKLDLTLTTLYELQKNTSLFAQVKLFWREST